MCGPAVITLSPAKPKSVAPYSFNCDAYGHCYDRPDIAMDKRHVFMLHAVLRAWPFKHALELGSFHGASSTAFIEAIYAGSGMDALFCDMRVTPQLLRVIAKCVGMGRANWTESPSWDVLKSDKSFDFVLVDACHDIESVSRELKELMRQRPLCVMAHDTNATDAGHAKCEGAKMLKETFQSLPEYLCIEDCKRRDGERTERGLFLAAKDAELFKVAIAAFNRYQ